MNLSVSVIRDVTYLSVFQDEAYITVPSVLNSD